GDQLAELELREVADEGHLLRRILARSEGDGEARLGVVEMHAPKGEMNRLRHVLRMTRLESFRAVVRRLLPSFSAHRGEGRDQVALEARHLRYELVGPPLDRRSGGAESRRTSVAGPQLRAKRAGARHRRRAGCGPRRSAGIA